VTAVKVKKVKKLDNVLVKAKMKHFNNVVTGSQRLVQNSKKAKFNQIQEVSEEND
jgi:hypothetical protein